MANLDEVIDCLSDVRQKIDNLDLSNRSQIDTKIIEKFQRLRTQLRYASDKAATANPLRECLFALRQAANQIRPVATNVDYLKEAIHKALVELAWEFPLNKINEEDSKLICSLSGNPFSRAESRFVLSNGYIYQAKELKEHARTTRNKPYFLQLGNISQYDVDAFHRRGKHEKVLKSMVSGTVATVLWMVSVIFIDLLSKQLLGMGIAGLVHSLLMAVTGLAMGATVVGITAGLVVLPVFVAVVYFLGKACNKIDQLDKKYSSTLEPDKSTSTDKMLNVMDGKPTLERQNLVVDQSNDAVLVPLLPSQDARNDVELGVVYQEQQVVEDNAARTYSVY